MKKLITLLIMGALLSGGTALAQDEPVRDGDRERDGRHHFIPRLIRNNDDAKALAEEFSTVREEFRSTMRGIRTRLEAADSEELKTEIKTEARSTMRTFRKAQREFRKGLRDILKELREARIADGEGDGS